jgi:hypothetical protein
MELGIQDKIQRAISALQIRLSSTMIKTLGTRASHCFFLSIEQDKYKNTATTIKEYGDISVVIVWPGNEIPMMLSNDITDSPEANMTPHLYDLLPIEMYIDPYDIKSRHIKKGDIILFKVKNIDDSWIVLPLQLVDMIGASTISNVVLIKWNAAPTTSYQLSNMPEYQHVIQEFKTIDIW